MAKILLTGVVTYFNPMLGYGFIHSPSRPENFFFHSHESFDKEFSRGDRVCFSLQKRNKKMIAVNTSKVK
jgi:cold shock CspA family protein